MCNFKRCILKSDLVEISRTALLDAVMYGSEYFQRFILKAFNLSQAEGQSVLYTDLTLLKCGISLLSFPSRAQNTALLSCQAK